MWPIYKFPLELYYIPTIIFTWKFVGGYSSQNLAPYLVADCAHFADGHFSTSRPCPRLLGNQQEPPRASHRRFWTRRQAWAWRAAKTRVSRTLRSRCLAKQMCSRPRARTPSRPAPCLTVRPLRRSWLNGLVCALRPSRANVRGLARKRRRREPTAALRPAQEEHS